MWDGWMEFGIAVLVGLTAFAIPLIWVLLVDDPDGGRPVVEATVPPPLPATEAPGALTLDVAEEMARNAANPASNTGVAVPTIADEEQVTQAFQIITQDPNVRGIFVNIFGGIMRCDIIATGIVKAVQNVGLEVPLVVRLEGTNVELGKQIIEESGLKVVSADNLRDGAEKILELTR